MVCLCVASEDEMMRTRYDKSLFQVKRDGLGIVFPHSEPEIGCSLVLCNPNRRIQEQLADMTVLILVQDIDPLQFQGAFVI